MSSKLISQGISSTHDAQLVSSIFSKYDNIFLSQALQEELILPYNYYHLKACKRISLFSSFFYGVFFFCSTLLVFSLSFLYSYSYFSLSNISNISFFDSFSLNILIIPPDIYFFIIILTLLIIISISGARKDSITSNLNRLYNSFTSSSQSSFYFPEMRKTSLLIHLLIGIICSALCFVVSYSISFIYSSISSA